MVDHDVPMKAQPLARDVPGVKSNTFVPHALAQNWRGPQIAALDTGARSIRDALDHLNDLTDMFEYEGDQDMAQDLRAIAAKLRSKASERENEAETLGIESGQ